jgi:hypothetical protein
MRGLLDELVATHGARAGDLQPRDNTVLHFISIAYRKKTWEADRVVKVLARQLKGLVVQREGVLAHCAIGCVG